MPLVLSTSNPQLGSLAMTASPQLPTRLRGMEEAAREAAKPAAVAGASGVKMDGTPSTPDPDTIKMFVGQVPRNWNELQCRELFEHYGPVYQLNILRDKQTQQSKGCCFVTYYHRKDAISAQSDLHNVKTLQGMHHPIQMKPADSENRNERKLFIGMISKKMSEEDVKVMFSQFGHIEDCTVLRDNDGRSKGCAFVTYASRANAQTAIKHMHHAQTMEGCSTQMVVKFADTQKDKEQKLTGSASGGKSGGSSSASPPASIPVPTVAANQLLQQNNLLSLLLHNPTALAAAGGQQNVLSLLGSVLTGLGRLSEQQQQSTPGGMMAPSQLAATSPLTGGSPGSETAAQLNPAIIQQQQQMLQQQKLLEYTMLLQQQQQAAAVAAAAQADPKFGGSSPKDMAGLYSVQQQQLIAAATQPQLDPYSAQLQALGMAGLMPQVSLAAAVAATPIVGNGQSKGPDGCNLFIYHLPQDFTDNDLYNTFSPFGTVLSAKVFIDKQTNLSKCFGFVSYDNSQSATNAISGMNGFQIGTKRLKVQLKNARAGHPYAM